MKMKNDRGETEYEEEDEEEIEEGKFKQAEVDTEGGGSNRGSDETDKYTRHSQSPSSSSETGTQSQFTPGRIYGQILQDIQKQKRRKAKLEETKEERKRIARDHLEKGIEGTNFKVPDNFQCPFDASKTGLGGARLTEDCRLALAREGKVVKDPVVESRHTEHQSTLTSRSINFRNAQVRDTKEKDDESLITDSTYASTEGTQRSSTSSTFADKKFRFSAPSHIENRLKPPSDEVIPWFKERLQLSSLSVRFEIPMDVREFRKMDIMTYLRKFCKIPAERITIYKQVYKQHKAPRTNLVTIVELSRAIYELLYDSVSIEGIDRFLRFLLSYDTTVDVDFKTFSVIAATAERILYLSCAETAGVVYPGEVRSFVESADFCSLKWKLRDIVVDKRLMKLMNSLG